MARRDSKVQALPQQRGEKAQWLRNYFYGLLGRYLSLFVLPKNSVIEIDPSTNRLSSFFQGSAVAFSDEDSAEHSLNFQQVVPFEAIAKMSPDYLLLNGVIHYKRDIQNLFSKLHRVSTPATRVIIIYYSSLWQPLMQLATWFGWRMKTIPINWLAHTDIENLLTLEKFELLHRDSKVLLPVPIPIVSQFVNRYLAPLPFLRIFTLVNIIVARPLFANQAAEKLSVSVIVPARNEAGNIEAIVKQIPRMGPGDEIILVEGHSSDNTWNTIQSVYAQYGQEKNLVITQQIGNGKGDAVRKGFSLAKNEILMILDADMTVPPEDLTKFYSAITTGKGEFINGSRLVYPMEKKAMRFFNLVGNKFFATAFSFVLGQRFKDTLCGTKVISKANYERLAENQAYFGEFDPFGDFDLIFGASRMCLKMVEIPINYRERVYGETNISRWKHGIILLTMLLFAARRIKFL